jgi:hypothetical protein
MSFRVTVSNKHLAVFELENQMAQLRALRRALCLLNASRGVLDAAHIELQLGSGGANPMPS